MTATTVPRILGITALVVCEQCNGAGMLSDTVWCAECGASWSSDQVDFRAPTLPCGHNDWIEERPCHACNSKGAIATIITVAQLRAALANAE